MPSLPNEFIPYTDNTMNQNDFIPIQINRNVTQTVCSTFVSSVNTNHANLFSPSPPFTSSFHASQVHSSTSTFNSSHIAYQTRRNMVSAVRMPQISRFVNPGFSPVLATPTIPNMYHHATVPTNNMATSQNGHDRGKHVITSGQTGWNHSPDVFGKVTPTISNMYDHNMVPTNNMVTSQNFHEHVITSDPTIHPPNGFNNQWKTVYPEPIDYTKVDTSDDGGENKYQTQSIPNEKYGTFTCPKCHSLFDITPTILAAHMGLVHASNETSEDNEKGPGAKTKKRSREQNHPDVNGKARKIKSEDNVPEEN
ncbi:hypothetical protein HA466_0317570 [Hirschfeldia incana]|nr:hypothetical protein HA466_0317570 [Hirschfeldia incana]